ncbi:MAG: hypothetical protein K1000chlam3_01559, partial [Chlamydiae bacterium]|nr:hypothetical protein [Chlamydiota bacterium]
IELRILGLHERDALLLKLQNKIYHPIQDLQGNIVRLIAQDHSEDYSYHYNAFSEESPEESLNPWRYASKRFDPETSLIYFGHRYYNPETGRWLTPDPSELTDSANLYAYTYNNPLLYLDAYGLLSYSDTSRPVDTPFIKPLPATSEQIKFLKFEEYMENKYSQSLPPARHAISLPPMERSCHFETPGIEIKDRMIMTLNGISTDYNGAVGNANYISKFTPGNKIHGVHAASFGFKEDIQRAFLGLNNIATEPVSLLHEAWNNYFQKAGPNATILVIATSRGCIDLRLSLFTFDKELRKRIYAVGIAPAAYIDPDTCGGVRHYRSKRDFIPNIDSYGARKFAHTIYTLDPHPDAKPHDHPLQSPTFKRPIRANVQLYLETGRIKID